MRGAGGNRKLSPLPLAGEVAEQARVRGSLRYHHEPPLTPTLSHKVGEGEQHSRLRQGRKRETLRRLTSSNVTITRGRPRPNIRVAMGGLCLAMVRFACVFSKRR